MARERFPPFSTLCFWRGGRLVYAKPARGCCGAYEGNDAGKGHQKSTVGPARYRAMNLSAPILKHLPTSSVSHV